MWYRTHQQIAETSAGRKPPLPEPTKGFAGELAWPTTVAIAFRTTVKPTNGVCCAVVAVGEAITADDQSIIVPAKPRRPCFKQT